MRRSMWTGSLSASHELVTGLDAGRKSRSSPDGAATGTTVAVMKPTRIWDLAVAGCWPQSRPGCWFACLYGSMPPDSHLRGGVAVPRGRSPRWSSRSSFEPGFAGTQVGPGPVSCTRSPRPERWRWRKRRHWSVRLLPACGSGFLVYLVAAAFGVAGGGVGHAGRDRRAGCRDLRWWWPRCGSNTVAGLRTRRRTNPRTDLRWRQIGAPEVRADSL